MLVVKHQGEKYTLRNDHPYVAAIVALAARAKNGDSDGDDELAPLAPLPKARDVLESPLAKELRAIWKNARPYRETLRKVASAPAEGIGHRELMRVLAVKPLKFRGMQTGLARICVGLGVENPILRNGYSQTNRVYSMEPEVARVLLAVDADNKARRKKRKKKA